MHIGGIILGAGMVMDIGQGDYRHGDVPVSFTLRRIVSVHTVDGEDWVVLEGHERPDATHIWRARRLLVRVSALKRSLALIVES